MALDLTIAIPMSDGVKDFTMESLLDLKDDHSLRWNMIHRFRDGNVGRSRSVLATKFLEESSADILLFIDSDMMFKPLDVRLLVDAQHKGHGVVAGGYLMCDGHLAIRTLPDRPIAKMTLGNIEEVEYVSTGFMSISRNVLLGIRKHFDLPLYHPNDSDCRCYPFFECGRDWTGKHNLYISEDWDFCEKAIQSGFKIYFHTRVLVNHIKNMILRVNPIGPGSVGEYKRGGPAF